MFPRVFIGPMSKNIVDAIAIHGKEIGFIPSRRQVEHTGGYVNHWNTKTFSEYANKNVILRDHAGPLQGDVEDDGVDSITADSKYFAGIHIDPWKKAKDLREGIILTASYMEMCYYYNPNLFFEIGTEEAIFKYSPEDLDWILTLLKREEHIADKIKYACIQCGTKLESDKNLGEFDRGRLSEFLEVCSKHNVLSKEHNGDYQTNESMKEKKAMGLYSINIAPEFGGIESKAILDALKREGHHNEIELFFKLCLDSNRWQKWVPAGYDPYQHKEEVIKFAGHYVYSNPMFRLVVEGIPGLEAEIREKLKSRIDELTGIWND